MAEKVTIEEVRDRLVATATAGGVIAYSDLYGDRWQARARSSRELGIIATDEHRQGHPLLSVVAVAKGSNQPRHGYWNLAKDHDNGEWCDCGVPLITAGEDEHDFIVRQQRLVYAHWHTMDPLGRPFEPSAPPPGHGREPLLGRDLDALDRGTLRHHETLLRLAAFLTSRGIVPHGPKEQGIAYDLGWRHGDTLWIAEVKSTTRDSEQQQLRFGLGQVLDYRQSLQRAGRDLRAALVVERQPDDLRWVRVCGAVDVLLVWPDRFAALLGTGPSPS